MIPLWIRNANLKKNFTANNIYSLFKNFFYFWLRTSDFPDDQSSSGSTAKKKISPLYSSYPPQCSSARPSRPTSSSHTPTHSFKAHTDRVNKNNGACLSRFLDYFKFKSSRPVFQTLSWEITETQDVSNSQQGFLCASCRGIIFRGILCFDAS